MSDASRWLAVLGWQGLPDSLSANSSQIALGVMKKTIADSDSPAAFDDAGMVLGHGPVAGADAADEYDEGDPFPLAAGGSSSTSAGSNSPVASIPTLADWLINGFWQNYGSSAHHWASN